MSYNKYYKTKDLYYYLVVLLMVVSSACSIIIQGLELPQSVRNVLNYGPWLVTVAYMIIYLNYTDFSHFKMLIFLAIPLMLVVLGSILGMSYNAALTRALITVCLIYAIGVLLGEYLEQKHFDLILKGIILSTLAIGLYAYFNVFGGRGLYSSMAGIANKNALGLIFSVPIVIMLFNNNVFYKLKFLFIPFFVVLVILCASRTCMVCCFIAIIFRIFIGNRNWKEKTFYSLLIGGVVVFLFANQSFYDRVVTEIFFKGYEEVTDENIYHITSGRTDMLKNSIGLISLNWFIGGGGYAFENFYLDTLLKVGIVGAIPIFAFILSPIYFYFKDRKNKDTFEIRNMLLGLCVLMLVNGLGEEMTPLGPGVKCFVLWLTFGYYMGLRNKNRELALYAEDDDESEIESEEKDESFCDNSCI